MKLEEAIMYLKKIAKEYKTYGDLDNPEFEDTKKIAEAIETVLQELEKSHETSADDAEDEITRFKKVILKNYIPKNKIKDKIEELDITENGEALEDIMDRQNYTITELIQFVLQELLEE